MKFAYADPNELMLGTEVRGRLLRIQVRTTRQPRQYAQRGQQHITGYIWGLRRGKGARKKCNLADFDTVALVALDARQIAYLLPSDVRQAFCIPTDGNRTICKTFADFSLDRALGVLF